MFKSYIRTQRVSSKIGTTENLGDYLYDWFTQGTGGPIDVVGSSFGVLENAEDGVVQVYTELGIEPPAYDSNPVFIPVQSFVHGDDENEIYWFHPDHLGSTSYITNLLGEVSQHMEYFAFGETFVEEHRSSNNSPYKFNGKELDEETGWYYYGARYYDPRISVWLSVDPLAEKYSNISPYAYAVNNPIIYKDPDGKEIIGVTKDDSKKILRDAQTVFADKRFDEFRNLLTLKGRSFNKIDAGQLKIILSSSSLSEDDRQSIQTFANMINSEDKHEIHYASEKDSWSESIQSKIAMHPALKEVIDDPKLLLLGGSQTIETKKGSYSLILEDALSANDYRNNKGKGSLVSNPLGIETTSFHELGHGRSLATGRGDSNQQEDAILFENMIIRVMGQGDIQRDGTDHGTRQQISDPTKKPDFQ